MKQDNIQAVGDTISPDPAENNVPNSQSCPPWFPLALLACAVVYPSLAWAILH